VGNALQSTPEESTILNFWQLLKQNALGELLFQAVSEHRQEWGLRIACGTIVDARIMSDIIGLYRFVLLIYKWGVRCLDCTTVHNRAGPCPVKIPTRFLED
jgi:hypothetical protein